MKRQSFMTLVITLGLLATPIPSNAQFFKNLGKALEEAGKELLQGSTSQQQTASVRFSNLRLTYDQIDAENGRKMLQVHYTLRVDGLQGHTLVPVLAIEIPQGTFHKFANGNDMKHEGNQLTCSYQSTTFNGQWQAIYIDALNPLPGKRTYYARIYLVDMTLRKQIAESEYLTFTNTGQQQQQPAQQPKSQQQAQQLQSSSSNHLTFQGIPMGQSGANIKAALKKKGFKDREYDMTGTLNGVSVSVWVADDGSLIRVSETKSNAKALAKKRYQQLKKILMETYHGKSHPMSMWDGGEGSIISTDKGYVEVFYRDADEVNFLGEDFLCEYVYKDKATMSTKEILSEEAYDVSDAISAETAIALYNAKNEDATCEVLGSLGYEYVTKDTRDYQYWCKNCSLTKALKPTSFTKGTSSIVKFRYQGQPDVRVQVFNENATQSFYDQLEQLGYGWQGTGTGTGALEWKKDMTDQNEQSFWLISSKGYFYQQHGGYFLILGGNIE